MSDTLDNDAPIFNDLAIEADFHTYWGDSSGDIWTTARRAAHRAYCKRAYEDAKEIADIKAKLAEAEQANESWMDIRTQDARKEDTLRADHAATVAELRMALEQTVANCGCTVNGTIAYRDDDGVEYERECFQCKYARAALATPSGSGAAAVLVAADRVYETEQAFAECKSAEVAKGRQGNARYREWPELMATIEAQEMLLDAVADCRKRLGK